VTESLLAAFLVALRESLELSLLLLLIDSYFKARSAERYGARAAGYGALAALVAGGAAGYAFLDPDGGQRGLWAFWGSTSSGLLFFSSPFLLGKRLPARKARLGILLFGTGFLLFFFEAGALASVLKGTGLALTNNGGAMLSGLAGLLAGLAILGLFSRFVLPRLDTSGVWSLSSLVLSLGAIRLASSGMDEFYEHDVVIGLQLGLTRWLSEAVHHVQALLLIAPHPYLEMPASGLMSFLGGDRIAMALTLAVIFFPPVWILGRLVAAPDPEVGHIRVGAEKRMTMALFRQDIFRQGIPMMAAFFLMVVQVHAANLSLNPLFDPKPVHVSADEDERVIRIPLADAAGDFSDRRIRKYVYFYGDRKIVFLAIQRPDGLVATALDECEICRPASWNVKAIGYAQRGENLVCKYCVTPISAHSVGDPGGCNPIPFESDADEQYLYIAVDKLIETWNEAQKIEKAGTHF